MSTTNKSDTPRTDAFFSLPFRGNNYNKTFAALLEKELNAANAELAQLKEENARLHRVINGVGRL